MKNEELFDLNYTIAKDLFENTLYPWEVLDQINPFIMDFKNAILDDYNEIKENVFVHKSAKIYDNSTIIGPCIICENAQIRPNAFIRENVIIGENVVVGNATELKNSILFDGVAVPHYNYVGDSILGYKAHLGAGTIASNLKGDGSNIIINGIVTNRRKVGAFLGSNVEVGCNSVLNPGTIVGNNTMIYPLSSVRGLIPANSIYKNKDCIIKKSV